MFCFVLLMIAATNLALGYAVATHFGFGPKPMTEIDAARARAAAAVPTFSIQGGEGNETPIDELLPAEPLPTETTENAAEFVESSDTNAEEDFPITTDEVEKLAAEMAEVADDGADSAEHVAQEARKQAEPS